MSCIDRHLIIGGVAILHAEVVVLKFDIEIRVDQLVFDELPDDARHLIAVHLDDGAANLDLLHVANPSELGASGLRPIAPVPHGAKRRAPWQAPPKPQDAMHRVHAPTDVPADARIAAPRAPPRPQAPLRAPQSKGHDEWRPRRDRPPPSATPCW